MSTSRLLQTVAHFKQQLMQHEASAQATLSSAHAKTLETINPILDILYRQMKQKIQTGETIPLEWLYEQRRLQLIKQQIENKINHFGALAQMQTGQLQHIGVQLGTQSATAQLNATVPAGISWSFGVPSPKAVVNLVGATQAGSPLADLFSGFGAEASDNVAKALITGITLGWNPRDVALSVQQALGISRNRALTISRDQLNNAYRSANMETFRANDDVVDGWVWVADLSARACAACIAMNGTKHSLDEEFGSHPCCRCSPAPETKSWDSILGPLGINTSNIQDTTISVQSGSDWLDNQDEATQKQVLGAKYEGWSNGDFTLKDIIGRSESDDWGSSIYEKSLKELVK